MARRRTNGNGGERTPSHASNIGHIPKRDVGPWCQGVIKKCLISQQTRAQFADTMKNFYYTGTADGTTTIDNEIFPEVDHLASSLFSPIDPRFYIGYDRNESAENRAIGAAIASHLSREFRRRRVDATMAEAVNWGLVEASCFVKLLWGRHGLDPYLVSQAFMGVYHEGIPDLDRQDAFVHTTFMTLASFERAIQSHPEADKLMRAVKKQATTDKTASIDNQGGIRQLLIGGTIPVNLAPPASPQANNGGWVAWIRGPKPVMDPQTLAQLVQLDELWVIDNDREDYTTFQLVGEIVVEGKLQRRNLLGIKGLHPFTQVCPNPTKEYFWGMSEIQRLMVTQLAIGEQVAGIDRIMRMADNPPIWMKGVSGNIDQKRSALMKPGGRLAEVNPQAEIKPMAPPLPDGALPYLETLTNIFHRQGGFEAPASRGIGDTGIRSGIHGDTAVRMSGARLRDRAILMEGTYSELGDTGLQILQAKIPDRFTTKVPESSQEIEFTLEQLPDDYDLAVDSHSTSPAFSEDARRLAFDLARAKAIDDIDLIRLTHPPQEDTLVADAETRRRQRAEMIAKHPELLHQSRR